MPIIMSSSASVLGRRCAMRLGRGFAQQRGFAAAASAYSAYQCVNDAEHILKKTTAEFMRSEFVNTCQSNASQL